MVKQQMIKEYFRKKSPKANKNRSQEKPDSQHETNKQGARDSPLEGEPDSRRFCPDQAGSQTLPSRDPGPSTEERGRSWRNEAQKRAIKALERWPPDSSQGTKSPKRGRTVKRLQGAAGGKAAKEGKEGVLQRWLRKENIGPEAINTSLGPETS